MEYETKMRIPLWIYPSTDGEIENTYESDNCKSKSEFIEKAVKFYLGYLKQEKNVKLFVASDNVLGRGGYTWIRAAFESEFIQNRCRIGKNLSHFGCLE